MTDLVQSIVACAIVLDAEERDARRHAAALAHVRQRVAGADAAALGALCRQLGEVRRDGDMRRSLAGDVHRRVREREVPETSEASAADRDQKEESARISEIVLEVRRGLREAEGEIAHAIGVLRRQPLEARIARLLDGATGAVPIDEIERLVRDDHRAVADAFADWRLMPADPPAMVLSIAESDDRASIERALRAMSARGDAVGMRTLGHRAWTGVRWRLATAA